MGVEAIMRIYNELRTSVNDLERELVNIPKESNEWNIVHSIIDAIKDTYKSLTGSDGSVFDKQAEDMLPERSGVSSNLVLICKLLKATLFVSR